MHRAKPQVFRFKIERREIGIQQMVMTEDEFKRWFIANGGKLVGKEPLADKSLARLKTPPSKAKRASNTRASRAKKPRPEPIPIPTVTVMSGDGADDPPFSRWSRRPTPRSSSSSMSRVGSFRRCSCRTS